MLELHAYKRVLIIRSENVLFQKRHCFQVILGLFLIKKIPLFSFYSLTAPLVASYHVDPQLYF